MSIVTLDAALTAMRSASCFYARRNASGKLSLYRMSSSGKLSKVNRERLTTWLLNNTEIPALFVDWAVTGVLRTGLPGFPVITDDDARFAS